MALSPGSPRSPPNRRFPNRPGPPRWLKPCGCGPPARNLGASAAGGAQAGRGADCEFADKPGQGPPAAGPGRPGFASSGPAAPSAAPVRAPSAAPASAPLPAYRRRPGDRTGGQRLAAARRRCRGRRRHGPPARRRRDRPAASGVLPRRGRRGTGPGRARPGRTPALRRVPRAPRRRRRPRRRVAARPRRLLLPSARPGLRGAATLPGALAAAVRTELEAVYGYQVALTRLDWRRGRSGVAAARPARGPRRRGRSAEQDALRPGSAAGSRVHPGRRRSWPRPPPASDGWRPRR